MPRNWPAFEPGSIRDQLRRHSVALISLVIAVSSLGYNTWRNETSEEHRNVRQASFRVLESLGELQTTVDEHYYYLPFSNNEMRAAELRLTGFGKVALIRDLMDLMPQPAPSAGAELSALWQAHVNDLPKLDADGRHSAEAREAERVLTEAITDTRAAVKQVLSELD